MAVRLCDSFSMLLLSFKRGEGPWWGDSDNCLYFFGSMKDAAKEKRDEFGYDYVMSELDKAEKDGRVFWREHLSCSSSENIPRFQLMLAKAREMGAEIPEYNGQNYDAFWNIPAMRRWFASSGVKHLDTPFRI